MSYAPEWVGQLRYHYLADNYHQFILDGNIEDLDFFHTSDEDRSDPLPLRDLIVKAIAHITDINQYFYLSTSTGLVTSDEWNTLLPQIDGFTLSR